MVLICGVKLIVTKFNKNYMDKNKLIINLLTINNQNLKLAFIEYIR